MFAYRCPQDRKVLLKTFKTHVTKVAKEEYGHMVLLVAFDVVDDVKFVQKVILAVSSHRLPSLSGDQEHPCCCQTRQASVVDVVAVILLDVIHQWMHCYSQRRSCSSPLRSWF